MSEVKVEREIPEVLRGVMSSILNEGLTVEDYARMAQVSADPWEESLIDHVVELSPDQFCALFDLARLGLQYAEAEQRGYQRCQNDVVVWLRKPPAIVRTKEVRDGVANCIEQGFHIGASDSVPSGREGE